MEQLVNIFSFALLDLLKKILNLFCYINLKKKQILGFGFKSSETSFGVTHYKF